MKLLLRLLQLLLELQLLWLALHLHLKLLTQGLELLHLVVIYGNGLMRHWLLSHLIQWLAHMIMVIHWVLVHLQPTSN